MKFDNLAGKLCDLWWVWWPRTLSRLSFTLGVAATDGAMFRAWARLGALLPPAGFALGILLGWIHPDPSFSASLVVIVLFVSAAGAGAAVGLMTWIGFVAADLVQGGHGAHLSLYGVGLSERLSTVWLPVLIVYLLLLALLVLIPLVSLGIGLQTVRSLKVPARRSHVVSEGIHVLVQAGATVLWSHSAAFLVRPLWSFAGGTPPIDAIEPLQRHALFLGIVAGGLTAARAVMAQQAAAEIRSLPSPLVNTAPIRRPPPAVAVVVRAGLLTLMVSGLLRGFQQGVVLFAVMAVTFGVQRIVLPRVSRYVEWVGKVPLLIRLALAAGVAHWLSGLIVDPALKRGETSFTSMVVVVGITCVVLASVFPGPPPHRTEASR